MRWNWKKNDDCDRRTKTWFALLPVIIDEECRWLETVTVKQIYISGWENIEFIDDTIQNSSSK